MQSEQNFCHYLFMRGVVNNFLITTFFVRAVSSLMQCCQIGTISAKFGTLAKFLAPL